MNKKFRCLVCGYVHEGPNPPAECPVCHAKAEKFVEIKEEEGDPQWACEHVVGVAKGCDPEIWAGLQSGPACSTTLPENAPRWACTWQ